MNTLSKYNPATREPPMWRACIMKTMPPDSNEDCNYIELLLQCLIISSPPLSSLTCLIPDADEVPASGRGGGGDGGGGAHRRGSCLLQPSRRAPQTLPTSTDTPSYRGYYGRVSYL